MGSQVGFCIVQTRFFLIFQYLLLVPGFFILRIVGCFDQGEADDGEDAKYDKGNVGHVIGAGSGENHTHIGKGRSPENIVDDRSIAKCADELFSPIHPGLDGRLQVRHSTRRHGDGDDAPEGNGHPVG